MSTEKGLTEEQALAVIDRLNKKGYTAKMSEGTHYKRKYRRVHYKCNTCKSMGFISYSSDPIFKEIIL